MIEQPLQGWKDIAAFLGTSPRSAQRWERELALPVHRLRTTTGSVVSAYPSELDTWRRRVGADLRSGQDTGPVDDNRDLEDNEGASEGIAIETLPAAQRDSYPVRPAVPVARWLALAAVLVMVTAAGISLWPGQQAPAAPTSVSGPQPVTGNEPTGATDEERQHGRVGGAPAAAVLRFTSGPSTARLRVRPDEMATLVLPGVPELRVRAIPSGSELTVELYWKPATGGSASGFVRVTALRLNRREPGLFEVSGATPIVIAWEEPIAKPG